MSEITREELKAHCKEQIAKCEALWAEDEEKLKNHRLYQEHKLILELLEQEPKTGHWINYKDEHQCSQCKEIVIVEKDVWEEDPYDCCPRCGAKMESEGEV